LLAVLLMWAVWLIAGAAVKNEYLVPPFAASIDEFFVLLTKAFFWRAVGATLARTVTAFLICFALALGCACLSTAFRPFAVFMRPIVALFRTLPTMAVLLLILVWLTPSTAPVSVAMLVLFPMIYSQLYGGIEGVSTELLQMAKVYKLTAAQKLKCIYLPHIAPAAIEQTGANLSFGIKLIVSAEVMASTYTALGGMMSEARTYLNLPRLAALTLVTVALGVISELAFRLISYLIFKRYKAVRGD
ncbi:MAG: ABC transporter permease subunit, partial [Clostridia bacterium]|nr:ABC transporter permease subunit [Clostridia bacterium]